MALRRLWATALAVAIFGLATTACASAAVSPRDSQPADRGPPPIGGDPLRLVGSWKLAAPGQEAGSVLRLGDDLTLWSSCGVLTGSWKADSAGRFAGIAAGVSGNCPHGSGDPTPSWLNRVVAYKTDAAGAQLLDPGGNVVATLRRGGHPTPGPYIAPELAQPPTVTPELRSQLRSAAPLPPGLTAAPPADLVGRWVFAANPTLRGDIDLTADGSWTGSDGVNDYQGRWSATADGRLVAVSGGTTDAGCAPGACANVPSWLLAAARAAFDGSTLVFVDADGKVAGRAIRSGSS